MENKETGIDASFIPRILAFFCSWCSYTGSDGAGTARLKMPPTTTLIRTMCSGRIDPYFLIVAFFRGADGVWVSGCHPGDCHYNKGNYFTRRRYAFLTTMFDSLGLETKRLLLSWISASEGHKFQHMTTEFTNRIQELGPNKARTSVFL